MRTYWLMPALCAASVLLASGCGGESSGPSDGGSNPPPEGDVLVRNNFYDPATFSVAAGSTVTWAWTAGPHTVTFSDANSGIKSSGTFEKTFPAVGSFPYHCQVHPEMTGTITVTAPGSSGDANPPAGDGGGGGGGMGGGGYGY
jgi:plastocyanin